MSEKLGPGGRSQDDEALLARLGEAVTVDAVPPEVVAAAKGSLAWLTIDADLAELSYDSQLDAEALAGVRGAPTSTHRSLTFASGDAVIELDVDEAGRSRRLEGQIVPAAVERLELHHLGRGETLTPAVDDLGRFRAEGLRPGRVRLLCQFGAGAGGATLLTEWVLL